MRGYLRVRESKGGLGVESAMRRDKGLMTMASIGVVLSAMASTGPVRSSRRSAAARSKPYARPQPQKKSPWAIATGLLSFLNPLKPRTETRERDEDELDEEPEQDRAAPENLSARGRQMAHNLSLPPPPPKPLTPVPSILPDTSSPNKNIDAVISFIDQRRGQPISSLEAEGLISLLNKSTHEDDRPEPFRFSSTPSTPARGNSPITPTTDIFTIGTSNPTPSSSPRRTLAKNPNGVYRWSGAGSARPSKNRYASPAFGTPSRASSPRLVFQDSPNTINASPKRRRVETPMTPLPATPPPVPRSAAPAPSPTRVAAQPGLATPAPTPSTPSRSLSKVKSVPVVPSPLRQAWGSSPASSGSSAGGSSPLLGATPTKAASLLTAIIKDADAEIPKRFADVRNPYQAASPVSVRVTNTHPPAETATRKRTRASGRANKEEAAKATAEKEAVPPQDIMEATMPEGSKRSRPPPNLNGSASLNTLSVPSPSSPRRSPRLGVQPLQEVEEEAEERDAGAPAAKRARVNGASDQLNGRPKDEEPKKANGISKSETTKSVEPPVSVFPVSSSAPSLSTTSSNDPSSNPFGGPISTSFSTSEFRPGPKPLANLPKEPSKLRYSFAPPPTPPPTITEKSSVDASAVASTSTAVPAKSTSPSTKDDPKEAARLLATSSLPTFVFTAITNIPVTEAHASSRDTARKELKSGLPSFIFAPPGTFSAQDKGKGKATDAPAPAPAKGFNWAGAGGVAPKAAAGTWKCGLCGLDSPEDKNKCIVCEADRPNAAPAAPAVKGFNWAGAAAPKAAAGTWKCGLCGLDSPEDKKKCVVCEADRPSAAPAAPAVKGFNWAAAGGAAPKAASGTWKCGLCGLDSPEDKNKCVVCEADRP
ncbi:E3 sumo-protein ligase 2-like protein [Mycena kentingensis (nom. inval.)]|nr:E3 sumo-protein ligase 2-like protein [Mycena kentingensis (nom. inval.)]